MARVRPANYCSTGYYRSFSGLFLVGVLRCLLSVSLRLQRDRIERLFHRWYRFRLGSDLPGHLAFETFGNNERRHFPRACSMDFRPVGDPTDWDCLPSARSDFRPSSVIENVALSTELSGTIEI